MGEFGNQGEVDVSEEDISTTKHQPGHRLLVNLKTLKTYAGKKMFPQQRLAVGF